MTTKREELKMRITYEPNRFSSTHLMDVYEALTSTINRIIPAVPSEDKESSTELVIDYEGEIL